ncbi:MAG: hypothetical protein JWP01_4188 [Myxococcales bacterium]|nr:hypothetical protein [Myxococcales bacterium]
MRAALFLAVAATALFTTPAHADDSLAEARQREAALDYQGALTIVEGALAAGGADPGRLAELHLFAGRLAAGLDRADRAEGHFARVLALRPELRLPEGTSPKLTAPFEAARARSIPLRLSVTSTRGLVTLHLDADALGLVAGVQVHVIDGAGVHSDVVAERSTRIAIPSGTQATEASALDVMGNRLWVGVVPLEGALGPRVPGGEPRSLIARWPLWAVVSGVALTTGAVATWQLRRAQNEWNTARASGSAEFSDLEDIERRGRRWGWTANIAFGAAIVTGLVAVSFSVRGDTGPIAFSVGPGPGTGLALGAQF